MRLIISRVRNAAVSNERRHVTCMRACNLMGVQRALSAVVISPAVITSAPRRPASPRAAPRRPPPPQMSPRLTCCADNMLFAAASVVMKWSATLLSSQPAVTVESIIPPWWETLSDVYAPFFAGHLNTRCFNQLRVCIIVAGDLNNRQVGGVHLNNFHQQYSSRCKQWIVTLLWTCFKQYATHI